MTFGEVNKAEYVFLNLRRLCQYIYLTKQVLLFQKVIFLVAYRGIYGLD